MIAYEKSIMDVVLQMQNTQMEMMQMLKEVREEIFRSRESNTRDSDNEGYDSNLNDILVSCSNITNNFERLKTLAYISYHRILNVHRNLLALENQQVAQACHSLPTWLVGFTRSKKIQNKTD